MLEIDLSDAPTPEEIATAARLAGAVASMPLRAPVRLGLDDLPSRSEEIASAARGLRDHSLGLAHAVGEFPRLADSLLHPGIAGPPDFAAAETALDAARQMLARLAVRLERARGLCS